MAETSELLEPGTNSAPVAGGSVCGAAPGGTDPVRVAVLAMAVVVVAGAVTFLGPILKPFLVAVFVFFPAWPFVPWHQSRLGFIR